MRLQTYIITIEYFNNPKQEGIRLKSTTLTIKAVDSVKALESVLRWGFLKEDNCKITII